MYWTGETCASCPEWLPNLDTEQKKCVPKCPDEAPYFYRNKCISCIEYSRDDYGNDIYWTGKRCDDSCPATAPVPDKNNFCRTCAETDPSKPFWDGFSCLPCSQTLDGEFFDGQKCVEECLESYTIVNGTKLCKTCAELDTSKPLWQDGECKACSDKPYYSGSECVSECPGAYLIPITG